MTKRLGDDKAKLDVQNQQPNDALLHHPPLFSSRPKSGMAVDLPDKILFFMESQITVRHLFSVY